MKKFFNVTAVCRPDEHYMVDITQRVQKIKELVDDGKYFSITKARQYGKTTTLRTLANYLQNEYCVISLDFQTFGAEEFVDENTFSLSFASSFVRVIKRNSSNYGEPFNQELQRLAVIVDNHSPNFRLKQLFELLSDICSVSSRPLVLLIDEVDSASNNQVFLDFLAQLRAYYIDREEQPTFKSVILAGVYDIRNLRRKIREDLEHKVNSPWNIAADFSIDMSFSASEIAAMLKEYENDYHTGMNIEIISELLYDYTSGYPFLVSKLCKLLDETIAIKCEYDKNKAWTRDGLNEALKILLAEDNTLFASLSAKLVNYPELDKTLQKVLFTGKAIVYNTFNDNIANAAMFGFVKNQQGVLKISNRIFEMWLYNRYLSTTSMQDEQIFKASLDDKHQFVVNGHLDMRQILARFIVHFNELYGDKEEAFLEEEGRKYFLLYLRPIINGTGNYYIEARTRNLRRTDVIVDYRGEQFIIELKIWRGEEYNNRGEQQLADYLDYYQLKKGYLLSFNFNKHKKPGIYDVVLGDKLLIEAVV